MPSRADPGPYACPDTTLHVKFALLFPLQQCPSAAPKCQHCACRGGAGSKGPLALILAMRASALQTQFATVGLLQELCCDDTACLQGLRRQHNWQ